jgi:hypothetical protein
MIVLLAKCTLESLVVCFDHRPKQTETKDFETKLSKNNNNNNNNKQTSNSPFAALKTQTTASHSEEPTLMFLTNDACPGVSITSTCWKRIGNGMEKE